MICRPSRERHSDSGLQNSPTFATLSLEPTETAEGKCQRITDMHTSKMGLESVPRSAEPGTSHIPSTMSREPCGPHSWSSFPPQPAAPGSHWAAGIPQVPSDAQQAHCSCHCQKSLSPQHQFPLLLDDRLPSAKGRTMLGASQLIFPGLFKLHMYAYLQQIHGCP